MSQILGAPSTGLIPLIPYPDGDLLEVRNLLNDEERESYERVREYLQEVVRPASVEYWNEEEFAFDLLPGLAKVGLGEIELSDTSWLYRGLVYAEAARADVSLSALVGIHNELILGMIQQLGSEEQRSTWLPRLRTFEAIGAFALTEPDHGSDIAGGLETTATRDGDEWIINGSKRWIGAGTIADFALVWARDTEDLQVKAFLVETDRPGYRASKIRNKMGLRIMQNADIELDDVRIPAENHLPGAVDFSSANEMLRNSRVWVGWQAYGLQMAAFDVAREYAVNRTQFGRPIAKFQLMQQALAEIAGNAHANLGLMIQVARSQEEGTLDMMRAAMGKSTGTRLARESAAKVRAMLGGNGITSDHEASKIFCDAEILYTYEGTYEINSLIVGRAVTGISAFV
ncbi:acyl-CoA dehydrogenase family protein [Kocuria sp. HSID16901]|uniref:acyl-CoA dehydrogenase family protein n=1 Tax=Kocuria sp. HSID16901 TaxID=2419505 RepID=UPI000F88B4B8|nr:acyl-CoA dehydrogenase family protein [Kocuria sp. HSID16901]MCT1367127.1 acyl-CoA dehydrogenase family protein [Rothia sp. p3-SID1597]RUQ21830.1 acyl-CoA dehydrogenase [Kocuria sp. HSID16901]